MGNLRLAQVPNEHLNKLFANLVEQRGVEGARLLIQENALLSASFPWCFSNEGHKFWEAIDEGHNPPSNDRLNELIKEAEDRGFAIGVNTKYGVIIKQDEDDNEIYEHELCGDGSFYYHNIKILSAEGKWCKPNKKKKSSKLADASAIHAMLDEIFKLRKQ